jgi:glycosyltransferase involved in cell wall biosynthesis
VRAIKAYDPDIVWIQHEFGLWPNARYWLSMMTQLSGYRVISSHHSVFPYHKDKTLCEVGPEIIVHLEGARQCLKETKGVLGKVHMIPHGCYARSGTKYWNRYGSEHTILMQGFGFRYKNWEGALRATAILKQTYPDVFFTGLFSESPQNKLEHHRYYAELLALVSELGIENHVGLIRGFQTDSVIDAFLRINRVALFPYISHPEHEVFGASGAARLAMSREIPVVTSTVNHFTDLPTVKADGPEAMAEAIAKLFDRSEAKKQVDIQNAYIDENSWAITAAKHIDVFCRRSV